MCGVDSESCAGDVSPTGSVTTSNAKARKRTKTGCLTCRRRRIKCGEERPTCANCIKSKRQCEGYNQRVIFKPPIGDWPNHPGVVSTLPYHNSMLPGTRASSSYRSPHSSAQPVELPLSTAMQPRALTHYDYQVDTPLGHLNTQHPYIASTQSYSHEGSYQAVTSPHHPQALHSPPHQLPTPTSATSYFSQPSPVHSPYQASYAQNAARFSPNPYQTQPSPEQSYYPYGGHSQAPLQPSHMAPSPRYSQAEAYGLSVPLADHSDSSYQSSHIPQHDVSSHVAYMPPHAVYGMSRV